MGALTLSSREDGHFRAQRGRRTGPSGPSIILPSPLPFPNNIEIILAALRPRVGAINPLNGPGPSAAAAELRDPPPGDRFLTVLRELTMQPPHLVPCHAWKQGRLQPRFQERAAVTSGHLASGHWSASPCQAGPARRLTHSSCSRGAFWWRGRPGGTGSPL